MIAVDPRTERTYVTTTDRALPPEQQTTFRYRPMTIAQQHAMGDDIVTDENGNRMRRNQGSKRLDLLRSNLVGWENLRTSTGTPIEFRTNKFGLVDEEALARVPFFARMELAIAIESDLEFTIAEMGKSEPPST